jgi:O-antigen/teichoic acid export membrane protein
MANTGWNLLGLVLPLLAALFAVPLLIRQIGDAGFGALSLIWVVIGYFSLFDLGLGRALTKFVAELAARQESNALDVLCSTSILLALGLGVAGALFVYVVAWFIVPYSDLPQAAIVESAIWVALCIPVIVLTAVFRGILEGFQCFRLLSLIRGPVGALMFFVPAIVTLVWPTLLAAVVATVMMRLLSLLLHWLPTVSRVGISLALVRSVWVKPLFHFGGWLTVSNVVGPVIVYVDRFVIGSALGAALLAYYAAPFELVSRLLMVPAALTAVLFPMLSQMRQDSPDQSVFLRRKAEKVLVALMVPALVVGLLLAGPFLGWWLSEDFREQSTLVLQVLLVGFTANAVAQITFTAMQSHGQTRLTATMHLIELPIYVMTLLWLVEHYGIVGAACGWTARAVIDWVIMSLFLWRTEEKLLDN